MKIHKSLYLLFFLLFPASPILFTSCSYSLFAPKPGTLSEQKLENILKEITVKVIADNEVASGTILKKETGSYTVLTNYHVVENAKSVKIVTPDNQVYTAKPMKLDRKDNRKDDLYDLATVTFSSKNIYQVAGLAEGNIKPGDKVFAGGYVNGNFQSTKGQVQLFLNPALIKGHQIAYNNNIQQGMSGGAIINEAGNLVGINSKIAHPVLQNDFRYIKGEQPDEETLNKWGNYSWGIAINLVDETLPDLALFPERAINRMGGIPANILAIAKQSSVRIEGTSGIGSGVIIAKENDIYYVLTAGHVVEREQDYQVVAPDKQVYKVDNKTIRTRKGLDMAVFQFRSSQEYQVAKLGDYRIETPFVFLYGWKGEEINYPSFFSVGNMKDADERDLWAKIKGYELAYTNEGYPGMSGGGIWDTEGRIIGIHNASETDVLGYSLGMSVQTFLFYQKDALWELPQTKLNTVKNKPKVIADIPSAFLAGLPIYINYTQPDPITGTGNDWLRDGNKIWRRGQLWPSVDGSGNFRIILMKRAINSMKQAIDKNPNLWEAYYNIAFILFSQNKYDDALLYINQAIEKKPAFYGSYFIKAKILKIRKDYKNAIHHLTTGIQEAKQQQNQDIFLALLYELRGEIFSNLGQYGEAIADYSQAISFKPQYTSVYFKRGSAYYLNKKIDLAISDFNQVININPNDGTGYYGRGLAYYEQEKVGQAIADYTQAIAIEPKIPGVYFNRGLAYFQQRKLDQALSDYNKSLSLTPELLEGSVYTYRAAVYILQGKVDLAITDFNKVISINPKNAKAYLGRGEISLRQGNKQLAIKDLETAKQLYQQQGNIQVSQKIQEILNKL